MTDASSNSQPAPMEGGGAYNRNSAVQAGGLLPAIELLEQAARAVPIDGSMQPIVIADYGSSAGRNSLLPMSVAIAELRQRAGAQRPISVVHTDLPGNDFSALFRTLESDPQSYLLNDPAVFASAVGRSFYGPVLPPDTVTLGWSSWSVQWLSRIPAPVPDHIQAAYSRDPATRAAYAKQTDIDWRCFLAERSRELRPNGRLVVLSMASDDEGEFGYKPLLAGLYASLLAMRDEGLIRAEELARMAIPTVGRTHADFLAPFGQLAGSFEGLRLESLEVFFGIDHIWESFGHTQDAKAFGASWAAFSRASVFPTLALALNATDDASRALRFMNELEARLAACLAAAPEAMRMPLARMVLVKD